MVTPETSRRRGSAGAVVTRLTSADARPLGARVSRSIIPFDFGLLT